METYIQAWISIVSHERSERYLSAMPFRQRRFNQPTVKGRTRFSNYISCKMKGILTYPCSIRSYSYRPDFFSYSFNNALKFQSCFIIFYHVMRPRVRRKKWQWFLPYCPRERRIRLCSPKLLQNFNICLFVRLSNQLTTQKLDWWWALDACYMMPLRSPKIICTIIRM